MTALLLQEEELQALTQQKENDSQETQENLCRRFEADLAARKKQTEQCATEVNVLQSQLEASKVGSTISFWYGQNADVSLLLMVHCYRALHLC
jgi:hypothetical protein